jgi:plastocyanin
MKRLILGLGFAALALATAACSGTSAAPATDAPAASAPAGAIVIVAKDLAFQPTEVAVTADTPTTIVLDNQEAAPHNIAITDASGASVFKGEIVSSTQVTNAVPALPAGTYTFFCEVHPNMKGTLTAS